MSPTATVHASARAFLAAGALLCAVAALLDRRHPPPATSPPPWPSPSPLLLPAFVSVAVLSAFSPGKAHVPVAAGSCPAEPDAPGAQTSWLRIRIASQSAGLPRRRRRLAGDQGRRVRQARNIGGEFRCGSAPAMQDRRARARGSPASGDQGNNTVAGCGALAGAMRVAAQSCQYSPAIAAGTCS
jgi:hypothetical protein